jgi:hypothetical protein
MTDQEVLRKALNEIDRRRYRMGWAFGIVAAASQAAWVAFVLQFGSRTATEKQLIGLATLTLALTVYGGVFILAILLYRLTRQLLNAIEVFGRRAES